METRGDGDRDGRSTLARPIRVFPVPVAWAAVSGVLCVVWGFFTGTKPPPEYFATAAQVLPTLLIAAAIERGTLRNWVRGDSKLAGALAVVVGMGLGLAEITALTSLGNDETGGIAFTLTLWAQATLLGFVIAAAFGWDSE